MTELATVIVGTKFYGAKALDAMDRMRVGDAVTLRRNEHPKDPNAVECHFLGVFVGFIPRITNPAIARAFDTGKTPIATRHRARPAGRRQGEGQTKNHRPMGGM